MRPDLSAPMLPACDLQAVLPQDLQLPADVREAHVLLQRRPRLCTQVCTGCGGLRGSGSVCGPGALCGSGSGDVRCSRSVCSRACVRSGPGDVCRSRSGPLCSGLPGSRDVRCSGSVRSGSGSGSGLVRCSLCSSTGSGQVLRHQRVLQQQHVLRRQNQVLQS